MKHQRAKELDETLTRRKNIVELAESENVELKSVSKYIDRMTNLESC